MDGVGLGTGAGTVDMACTETVRVENIAGLSRQSWHTCTLGKKLFLVFQEAKAENANTDGLGDGTGVVAAVGLATTRNDHGRWQ